MITHALYRFVDIASVVEASSKTHQNVQDRNLEAASVVAPLKKSNKGGSIPRDNARDLMRLFSIAAIILMNSGFIIFKRKAFASGVNVESKLSLKPVWSEIASL